MIHAADQGVPWMSPHGDILNRDTQYIVQTKYFILTENQLKCQRTWLGKGHLVI